jgi:hypothetical protein
MRLWALVITQADGGPVAVEHVGGAAMSVAGVDAAAVALVLSASPRETVSCGVSAQLAGVARSPRPTSWRWRRAWA